MEQLGKATHFLLELRSVPPHADAPPDPFPLAATMAAIFLQWERHIN
jgi:hypothetical protein